MNIQLKGYFDKNFGDDMMQRLTVERLSEFDFYVRCPQRENAMHLENLKNVHMVDVLPRIDATAYVVGTGFIYNGKRAILEEFLRLFSRRERNLGRQAVIDCSLEAFSGRISEAISKRHMRPYELISARDETSYAYFRKHFPQKEIFHYPELLFSMDRGMLFPPTGEDCLGIVVVRRLYSPDNYAYFRAVALAADEFIEETGKKVLLFSFDCGNENDIAAAISVRMLMRHKEMAELVMHCDDGTTILRGYARCGKIISSRFHGVILAMLYGLPVLAVSDTEKLRRICRDYGGEICGKKDVSQKTLSEFALDEFRIAPILPDGIAAHAAGHLHCLKNFLQR